MGQQPLKQKESFQGKGPFYRYATTSMQGWRPTMEDAHLILPSMTEDSNLFAIFDGHGGAEAAKFVEENFEDYLKQNQHFKNGKIQQALHDTFIKMDSLMLAEEEKPPVKVLNQYGEEKMVRKNYSTQGCTANVALIYKNKLYCANAGDSRCIVISDNSTIHEMSKDHKTELDVEQRRILSAGGRISECGRINNSLNFTRSLGDLKYKKDESLPADEQLLTASPEIQQKVLTEKDDFILMGCDGIWETMPAQQMVKHISQGLQKKQDLVEILEQLLDQVISPNPIKTDGLGCDNMTAILIVFDKNYFMDQQQQQFQKK